MKMTFPCKKRGSLVISVAILKTARTGSRITHLLNSASLSYEQFIRYIEFLKDNEYIEQVDGVYQTTDKGLQLIKEFDSSPLIRSMLAT